MIIGQGTPGLDVRGAKDAHQQARWATMRLACTHGSLDCGPEIRLEHHVAWYAARLERLTTYRFRSRWPGVPVVHCRIRPYWIKAVQ
jgi:hypothetical protein